MANLEAEGQQKLSQAILTEAQDQARKILDQARQQVDSMLATASAKANEIHQQSRAAAHAEATRHSELIKATIPIEAERLRSQAVEEVLEEIHAEVKRRLSERQDLNNLNTLVMLAADPIRVIHGKNFTVRLAPEDCSLFGSEQDSVQCTSRFAEMILRQAGRSDLVLTIQPDKTVEAGVIVQDERGQQVWDNQLTARLDRLWPELKRQLALQTGLIVG